MIGKPCKPVIAGSALLVLLVVVAYFPALQAGFIWDDDAHLTENACIVGPLGFGDIWTSSAAVYYPLVLTSFWVQHALWGLSPLPYHLINILMHGLGAVVLWRALAGLNVRGAWLGAALWAVHPVQVESVAWITELKNTQSGLFYLLAIFCFVKWHKAAAASEKTSSNWYYALVLLWAVLAVLSKAATVMLPVVLGLCGWWLEGRWRWRNIVRLIPLFAISAAASGWTIWEQQVHSGASGGEWSQSLVERIVIAGNVVWFYLSKLLWPQPLIFIYPRWEINAVQPLAYVPALAVAVGLLVLWRFRNDWSRAVFFAFAYFVVLLFPVLGFFNVYFFRYSFVGDHFQYLAAIGPLALAGAALHRIGERFRQGNPWLPRTLPVAVLAGLSLLTWQHTQVFRDDETLWRDTLAKNPGAWMARDNLGAIFLKRGEVNEAVAEFTAALQLKPDDAKALGNLGGAMILRRQYPEAIAYCEAALKAEPNYVEGRANLANALAESGHTDEAIGQYQQALTYQPYHSGVHNALGIALAMKGQTDEAIEHFQTALLAKPNEPDTHDNLGTALAMRGRLDEAITHYQASLRLNPRHLNTRMNYGSALASQQRYAEAITQYNEVVRAAPGYAPAYRNWGMALAKLGQTNEAVAYLQEALKLDPNLPQARQQLEALGTAGGK